MTSSSGKPLVLRSIESADGTRCVDLFRRPAGDFGFEEYRRDPEDPRGWAPAAAFGGRVFPTAEDAHDAARVAIAWLAAVEAD